jgi:hypothetical protein
MSGRVKSIESGMKKLGSGVEAICDLNRDENIELKYFTMELVTNYFLFTQMFREEETYRSHLLV